MAAGTTNTATVCDASGQLAVGLIPVLKRIRGWIGVDPDISPTVTTAQFWTVFAALHLNATTPDFSVAAGWADESVIWSGMWMSSAHYGITAGADSELISGYAFDHQVREIDVKAQRRMEQPTDKVFLSVRASTANTDQVVYSAIVRCLHAV